MTTIAIEKASSDLADLINRVRAGEEIVIMRGSEPLARLVPVMNVHEPRKPGALKGKIELPDSFFFEPLPDDELERWWVGGLPK